MGEVFAAFATTRATLRDHHRRGRQVLLPRLGPEGGGCGEIAGHAITRRRIRRASGTARPRQTGDRGGERHRLRGGFEIALSADIILAADHATFALPEIRSGTLADAATIKLPRRIPFHVAMDLLFTGRVMDATRRRAGAS